MAQGFKFRGDFAELELAAMCRRFNCMPSDVLREDAAVVKRTYALMLELDKVEEELRRVRAKK